VASTPAKLMTYAEFERLPDHPAGLHYELRHGELVKLAPPKHQHYRVQQRLRRLLENAAGNAGEVGTEMGYRPRPEYEYWEAGVAFLSRARWNQIPPNGNLQGAPELVVEVLSPSNTESAIREKRKLCLENGPVEFWVVDINKGEVEVFRRERRTTTYDSGTQIPLFFSPAGTTISVDEIFA
jgi:Uma2 family endonuclease